MTAGLITRYEAATPAEERFSEENGLYSKIHLLDQFMRPIWIIPPTYTGHVTTYDKMGAPIVLSDYRQQNRGFRSSISHRQRQRS